MKLFLSGNPHREFIVNRTGVLSCLCLILLSIALFSSCNMNLGSSYILDSYDYSLDGASAVYVSKTTGSDSNKGTENAPFATVLAALNAVSGDSVIYVDDGDYGDLRFGAEEKNWQGFYPPIDEVFDEWVTILPLGDADVSFGSVRLGTLSRSADDLTAMPFSMKGNSDLRLRIDGVAITDGIRIKGSRHVDIRNCRISCEEYYTWTTEEERFECVMNHPAVQSFNGGNIIILNNDISHAGFGAWLMSNNLVFKGNEVHNLMHDGIQVHGGTNVLIEDNVIHDLDDGDSSGVANKDMHVDGMHIYLINAGQDKYADELNNFTFRNNLIYHCECMDIMLQGSEGYFENFLWENNIFGPSGGTCVHFGGPVDNGFVIRHNTVVFTPNDIWTSEQNSTVGTSENHEFNDPASWAYMFHMWATADQYRGIRFYNNILTTAQLISDSSSYNQKQKYAEFLASNIFNNKDKNKELDDGEGVITTTLPYETISGGIQNVIDAGKLPGTPISGSAAVDSGAASPAGNACKYDYLNRLRDGKPDIGAIEF